jgi:hypothetical protein
MNYTDWIGTIGVTILLAAFLLNLFNLLDKNKPTYTLLNILGAGIACYASVLLKYTPFIVLEGSWAAVSLAGLYKFLK